MITYVQGNLFETPAHVLVNTVNTVGVMGKGIALQFKQIYPEMFREYQGLCESKQLAIGRLHVFKTKNKWVLNFPTKEHWRQPSRIEYIEAGLRTFRKMYVEMGIDSVAFPPLGCGNGQLDFEAEVGPLMQKYLDHLPIDTFIYPPVRAVDPIEHVDPKATAEWLRSEPASLAFEEVWHDIAEAIEDAPMFTTTRGSEFTASVIAESPPTLAIEANGKSYQVEHNDLLEFWQQLRQHGLTHRRIASEHMKMSYLMPVFERLPYVRSVRVSTTSGGLQKNAAMALQVQASALPRRNENRSLFSLDE